MGCGLTHDLTLQIFQRTLLPESHLQRCHNLQCQLCSQHVLRASALLQVDVLVCGVGTGGTITGAGRFMKEKNPNIKVCPADTSGCSSRA